MDRRRTIISIALLTLVTGSWLLTRSAQKQAPGEKDITAPDYFIQGLTARTFDKKGQLSQQMIAKRLIHYPEDDSTALTTPRVSLFDENKPPWKVKSKSGWVSGDGELVLLKGGVSIRRDASKTTAPVRILTEDLRIQPNQNYLETDGKVNMVSRKSRIEATGMQAWFNGPVRIKLLADARGHYEIQ